MIITKWAARVTYAGNIEIGTVEVKETDKLYIAKGRCSFTNYRTHISKDANTLFNTKQEALDSLCRDLEQSVSSAAMALNEADALLKACQREMEQV